MKTNKIVLQRLLLPIAFTFLGNILTAQQIQIDSCGLNTVAALNSYEADYFNQILKTQRVQFDFKGKRVAFAEGNWGKHITDKKTYFKKHGKPRFQEQMIVVNQLILLEEAERRILPGYDAIIISWTKMNVKGKKRRKLIQRIRKQVLTQPYLLGNP